MSDWLLTGVSQPPLHCAAMRSSAVSLLLVAALAACTSEEPTPFFVISGPKELVSFEVRDHGGALWRIEAAEPATLASLSYGITPAGFRQTVPADGSPPRPLGYGEALSTHLVTTSRFFRHRGYADGPASWEVSTWEVRVIGKTISAAEVAAEGLGSAMETGGESVETSAAGASGDPDSAGFDPSAGEPEPSPGAAGTAGSGAPG